MASVCNDDTHSPTSDGGYSSPYYPQNSSYNHSSPPSAGYNVYSPAPGQASDDSVTLYGQRHSHHPQIHRPQSTHPYSTTYSQSQPPNHSQSYAYSHHSSLGQTRARSHSQAHPYIAPPTNATYQSQYPPQIPLSPASPTSPSQYPASPSRPFACDLCTLSFNRQHDLKRHRETHTGEKPYFCNGGCGKTFTRKDALKRHQLVKGCGKPDEPWPPS
ncbi:hypothetical protein P691DRAFT_657247 [Macrolepiota fuliginosa MF-IS2]|uniref:C2H2-type domain-containing protein n=1 Tax=Macrolepiota fuliginosa MF-IS2 TaxID=1400762 RepID=A0A9P5XQS4_9AGAR|nr:hypothetical protein P691DRAFT_657247 [Macrolepiota fuliginosa MF-IS2]